MWYILKEHEASIVISGYIFQDLCFATELKTIILPALCMQLVLKSIQQCEILGLLVNRKEAARPV